MPLSVRAPQAWLGPGRLTSDVQIDCEHGEVRRRRAPPPGPRRGEVVEVPGFLMPAVGGPARAHRALRSHGRAAAGRDGRPRPGVAGRAHLPARRRVGDAELQRSADPGRRSDADRARRVPDGRSLGARRHRPGAARPRGRRRRRARPRGQGRGRHQGVAERRGRPDAERRRARRRRRRGARGRHPGDGARTGRRPGGARARRRVRRARALPVDPPPLRRRDPRRPRSGCGSSRPWTSVRSAAIRRSSARPWTTSAGSTPPAARSIYGTDLGNGAIPPASTRASSG